jgi:hypothetical protein
MSGHWENASGTRHATWATITGVVHGNTGEVVDAVMAAVPVSELRLEDTWHTVGMRGTGSNTWVGRDIFVPEHMVVPVAALVDETRRRTVCVRGTTPPAKSRGAQTRPQGIVRAFDAAEMSTTGPPAGRLLRCRMVLFECRVHLSNASLRPSHSDTTGNAVGASPIPLRLTAGHPTQ